MICVWNNIITLEVAIKLRHVACRFSSDDAFLFCVFFLLISSLFVNVSFVLSLFPHTIRWTRAQKKTKTREKTHEKIEKEKPKAENSDFRWRTWSIRGDKRRVIRVSFSVRRNSIPENHHRICVRARSFYICVVIFVLKFSLSFSVFSGSSSINKSRPMRSSSIVCNTFDP